ncbi:PREDICTED: acyltransferase-like protein At3g26840, chloroplastic isoform X3 [Camelina sativa]|uniref:Acyltransferase-like protein At3g26840, chloroplastic isoform X3 n=1 Tax=Camelina sativa TaxID=90675 RepID=A0ABM0UHM4_CAMSA|nr:PREDICTED: acyltransferase-like protein At3g26840, chloroplastic isoform X3 [Camelina sativa]
MAVPSLCIADGTFPTDFFHWSSTRRPTYDRFTNPKLGFHRRFRYGGRVTATVNPYSYTEAARPEERKGLNDFLVEARGFVRSDGGDGGPPRWFSPLECGARAPDSPLLLYLPGIDGTGLGLIRQYKKLGEIFDIWCLHFPVSDRTPARDIVKLIERTVRSEYFRLPNRPIYIVGESIGASFAIDVAASNPDIDLVLILANPVTRFNNIMLQPLSSLLEILPDRVPSLLEEYFRFEQGYPFAAMFETMLNETDAAQMGGGLLRNYFATSVNLTTLVRIFPKDTLLWKLQLLKSASASAKSHMYTVKAQTLILLSGRDQWLLNKEDIERLRCTLPKCEVRKFENNGQLLFLEDGVDLVTIIKCSYYYRRGKLLDYVSDYIPPTPFELKEYEESQRLLTAITSPVFLSTLENGTVVRSLAGIPSEGPVLYVGNHMLLGTELRPAAIHFLKEKNISLRGMAHPVMFTRKIGSKLPDMQMFDSGEAYKLFWPEHSEFVRTASTFGAKIIPFGVVGEDDLCEVVFDYNDQMKIPILKNLIKEITEESTYLRTGEEGEVGNQDLHMPGIIPKIPGRYYVHFGKPIETKGREKELKDKERAHEVYLQVKSEVERCMTYLKTKRETDPYRNILPRSLYHLAHGFSSEIPTFDL